MSLIGNEFYLVVLVAAFIWLVRWVFGARRKSRFKTDGKIPFEEND